eukprot:2073330-Rhodomonas_salina.1
MKAGKAQSRMRSEREQREASRQLFEASFSLSLRPRKACSIARRHGTGGARGEEEEREARERQQPEGEDMHTRLRHRLPEVFTHVCAAKSNTRKRMAGTNSTATRLDRDSQALKGGEHALWVKSALFEAGLPVERRRGPSPNLKWGLGVEGSRSGSL